MVQAVATEEGYGNGFARGGRGVVEDGYGSGGGSPWCGHIQCGDMSEVGERLEAGAADYCDMDGVWEWNAEDQKASFVELRSRKLLLPL